MRNPLSYTSRDFDSIKTDLINAISSLTDIWTSREQSDPGMVLVTLMAALGDMLSFNMDKQSLEFFGKTVTQRKNAQYIFDLLGYKMHWYESAQLKINVNNFNSTQPLNLVFNPSSTSSTQILTSTSVSSAPQYFILNPNETANNWSKNTIVTIPPNSSQEFIAVQGILRSTQFTSASIDKDNRFYLPVAKIDQNNMWLKDESGAYNWYKVDNLSELSDTLPRFEFGVNEYNMPYIELVPYWRSSFGGKDNRNLKFTLYYLSTFGSSGAVSANILNSISNIKFNNENFSQTDIVNSISVSHSTNAYLTDDIYNIPGKDPETPSQAYAQTRNIIGTYNTLVTVVDFERFFRRLGFSNSLVIDGQRAKDLNSKIDLPENYITTFDNTTEGISTNSVEYVTELPTLEQICNTNSKIEILNSAADLENVDTSLEDKIYIYKQSDSYYAKICKNNNLIDYDRESILGKYYSLTRDYGNYNEGIYFYTLSLGWIKCKDYDSYGFSPYSANAYLIWNNLWELDALDPRKSYATSESVAVEGNNGYKLYRLSNTLVGSQNDSLVSSKEVDGLNLENSKLISSDVNYAGVRKFPFLVDGKIYLKEPMSPANANLVLRNVYSNLVRTFDAKNLTFGKKIKFSTIIDAIVAADDNIDYFDAGANNSNGSLIVYPKADVHFDPYNSNTDSYNKYDINIDPKYFNPVSIQHYEDILFDNNTYLYWSSTASGSLSIAEDSIKEKNTPVLPADSVEVDTPVKISNDESDNDYYMVHIQGTNQMLNQMYSLFEYAFVKNISATVRTSPDDVDAILESLNNGEDFSYLEFNVSNGANATLSEYQPEGKFTRRYLEDNSYNAGSASTKITVEFIDYDTGESILYNGEKRVEEITSLLIFCARIKSTSTTYASNSSIAFADADFKGAILDESKGDNI